MSVKIPVIQYLSPICGVIEACLKEYGLYRVGQAVGLVFCKSLYLSRPIRKWPHELVTDVGILSS